MKHLSFVWSGGFGSAVAGVVMLVFNVSIAPATLITIHNTSSSHVSVIDLNTGLPVTNITAREGSYVVDLQDNNHPYEIATGVPLDQGSHWFYVNAGAITFAPLDATRHPTAFFTNSTPTSLRIGSVPIRLRLLSGPASTILGGGVGEQYFPAVTLSPGDTTIVNLVPYDKPYTAARGDGFDGDWKNVFPYSLVQTTPFQVGTGGLVSMTTRTGTMGTIVPSSVVLTNFTEGGVMWRGYQFTVDRVDGAQLGDGAQFLFFSQVPEPSTVVLCAVGIVMIQVRRRQIRRAR